MAATPESLSGPHFEATLARHGIRALSRKSPATIQVNVGKLCNQACHHCHVDAGPRRTERMTRATAARVLDVLAASPRVETLDITGGAPELNENFAMLVERARSLGRTVIVRCNLTVTLEPGMEWLLEFYRRAGVELVCSLPCYTAENTDRQRGAGVFDKSIAALKHLNAAGFGRGELRLDLVYNPIGAALPPPQAELEAQYRDELARNFGIVFDRLLTITNMPIARFANQLRSAGNHSAYMSLLVNHFNPATVEALMCRDLVSVGWDGRLYDCDFNQMLEIPLGGSAVSTIWDIDDVGELVGARIATASHCFGCTAGAGSSCGGAIA
ncbi:MAG TPA: arsenosugar biosynthesis radical SAM (seleno)protein ArsS [Candidatus Binatus sp.]|uniref:arsenosugar biosynthesis radical SAM (seleno)protein ArsS n=1 Tax=Candidatus Binatus sp. TaxID=2811406 RepID=UPI002B49A91A|nr:arsenosugar biosynthesis radical SAM (seleno)protein ArsS [Candidatus Binatus sp.]HKN12166.1 arsenosugar biosynthesis radical SAM (seleno)protein ArsS [Candidatus Binatus sp.]